MAKKKTQIDALSRPLTEFCSQLSPSATGRHREAALGPQRSTDVLDRCPPGSYKGQVWKASGLLAKSEFTSSYHLSAGRQSLQQRAFTKLGDPSPPSPGLAVHLSPACLAWHLGGTGHVPVIVDQTKPEAPDTPGWELPGQARSLVFLRPLRTLLVVTEQAW